MKPKLGSQFPEAECALEISDNMVTHFRLVTGKLTESRRRLMFFVCFNGRIMGELLAGTEEVHSIFFLFVCECVQVHVDVRG